MVVMMLALGNTLQDADASVGIDVCAQWDARRRLEGHAEYQAGQSARPAQDSSGTVHTEGNLSRIT